MSYSRLELAAILATALVITGCSRNQPTGNADRTGEDNRAAPTEAQRNRDDDINRLEKRLDDVNRKWSEKEQKLAQDRAAATKSLQADVRQDITNARQAVANLRTTTPDNWWEREEGALERTTGELEHDVQRFTGKQSPPASSTTSKQAVEHGTAFTARRDQFINELQPRVDAMKRELDAVKAKGTEKTELEDTEARVKKLDNDLAGLRNATTDDWWKISRDRVSDYIDRLEKSVGRLDDNKPKS